MEGGDERGRCFEYKHLRQWWGGVSNTIITLVLADADDIIVSDTQ